MGKRSQTSSPGTPKSQQVSSSFEEAAANIEIDPPDPSYDSSDHSDDCRSSAFKFTVQEFDEALRVAFISPVSRPHQVCRIK